MSLVFLAKATQKCHYVFLCAYQEIYDNDMCYYWLVVFTLVAWLFVPVEFLHMKVTTFWFAVDKCFREILWDCKSFISSDFCPLITLIHGSYLQHSLLCICLMAFLFSYVYLIEIQTWGRTVSSLTFTYLIICISMKSWIFIWSHGLKSKSIYHCSFCSQIIPALVVRSSYRLVPSCILISHHFFSISLLSGNTKCSVASCIFTTTALLEEGLRSPSSFY